MLRIVTKTLQNGSRQLRTDRNLLRNSTDRPKDKACVTGSDSFRKRTNRTLSRSRERTPKTGTNHDIGNRHRRATCLAVLHISEHKKTPCKILRLAGCFRIFLYCNSIYWSHSYASFGPPSKVIRPQYSNPSRTRICCITLFSS